MSLSISNYSDTVNNGGIISSAVAGTLDVASEAGNFNGASKAVKNMVGAGKTVFTVLGHGFNAIGGYITGKEVAEQQANGNKEHDTSVKAGAILGGIAGSVGFGAAGGSIGTSAGAIIGTMICPGIGTAIGAVLGGTALGYIGSSVGGSAGAEIGAKMGENVYNAKQSNGGSLPPADIHVSH